MLPLIAAMRGRPDQVLLSAETLHRMFNHKIPELVSQVLRVPREGEGEGEEEC